MASTRNDFYASNHTELAGNTPAAVGPAGSVLIAKVVVTVALSAGSLIVYDGGSASGALIYESVATPTAGTVADLHVRCKNGCWVVPGTGTGNVSVYWG
jgi:hypothetical protein